MPGERKKGVKWPIQPSTGIELRYLEIQILFYSHAEDKHLTPKEKMDFAVSTYTTLSL